MHIHLPKPLHGWREILGEVGIIVVGIMIALAAEQAVESLHWHEKANDAREKLQSEVADSYLSSAERVIETPCLNAQLDRLKDAVLRSKSRLSPVPTKPSLIGPTVFRYSNRLWSDSIWQSTLSEQVSSHLTDSERDGLSVFYTTIVILRDYNRQEVVTAGELSVLALPLSLDPSLRAHLLANIESERLRVNTMKIIAQQGMEQASSVFPHVKALLHGRDWLDELKDSRTTVGWCRSAGLPLAAIPQ